jgi:hypothetical protein
VDSIAGRRRFRSTSFYQGRAGEPSERLAHGIATDPLSIIGMSASGVVSIALAKTSLVLLSTISSKTLPPCSNDLIECSKTIWRTSRLKRGVQLYSKSSTISKRFGHSQNSVSFDVDHAVVGHRNAGWRQPQISPAWSALE